MSSPSVVRISSPTMTGTPSTPDSAQRHRAVDGAVVGDAHHVDPRLGHRGGQLVGRRGGVTRPHRVEMQSITDLRELEEGFAGPAKPPLKLPWPLMEMSAMATDIETPIGSTSMSPPTATTSESIRWMVEPMVTSRTGSASLPSRNMRPSAPVEKSPDTGLTPECRPLTLCTSRPSPRSAMSSSWLFVPGSSVMARQATEGVLLMPRTAEPVDAVPDRRPV